MPNPVQTMSVLTLEKWLPMSTTLEGLPFLPNLVSDQIQIGLTDEQMVNLQCSALWTSDCLLLVLKEFSIATIYAVSSEADSS